MQVPDTIALVYRPDLAVLTVRWLTDSNVTTLRDEYEAVLLADDSRRSPRWLFDVRRRPTTDAEAAHWVIADWLPRAAVAIAPARLRLAYLVTHARIDPERDAESAERLEDEPRRFGPRDGVEVGDVEFANAQREERLGDRERG